MTLTNKRNGTLALTGAQSDTIAQEVGYGAQRAVIVITNLNAGGGAPIWLSNNVEAKKNYGIQLNPGEHAVFAMDAGYKPSNDEWNAWADAAGSSVAIYEEIVWIGDN
jgi:hypothetical protein